MGLVDLWAETREQLEGKNIQQLIAFAGSGRLQDGSDASGELRAYLGLVPTEYLLRYSRECLETSFTDSGLALQEVVNQIGQRLGFKVTHGRYRGIKGEIGFDGLWELPGHAIVVEVKTTDAYRMALDTVANYRGALIRRNNLSSEQSSALIVVGREDTGDLEAQIRGSRHAWDIRLISVRALERLLALKEDLEDPEIIRRIHEVLIPREFTKLDEIVDLLFSAAEDVRDVEVTDDESAGEGEEKKFTPVSFHASCISEISGHLTTPLMKRTRASFSSPDGTTAVVCAVSKEHARGSSIGYWFAFHPHQREFLESAKSAYVAFGCGSASRLVLVPFETFAAWLPNLNKTELPDRFYWHVRMHLQGDRLVLAQRGKVERVDVTSHLLRGPLGSI
ncbi:MAG: hypothetical protein DHS20C21_02500 [Gemmatimonadota bacterium]|nr:MAG: hypothetical protein DHS20C21_02500 [Gemmatimonadota bacterium]